MPPGFHNPHFNLAPPTANVQIQLQPAAEGQPMPRLPWRPLETVTCFKVTYTEILLSFAQVWWHLHSNAKNNHAILTYGVEILYLLLYKTVVQKDTAKLFRNALDHLGQKEVEPKIE